MFIRYEVMQGLTNNTTSARAIMQDIYDALTGTITDPTNFDPVYCNRSLSTINGSIDDVLADDNTTNVYHSFSIDANRGITFQKRHFNYGVTTNGVLQDGDSTIKWLWDYTTPQPMFRAKSTGSGYFPYNNDSSDHYWVSNNSSFTAEYRPSSINRINIFATKYWFFVQIQESTTNKLALGGLIDYEMDSGNAWGLHSYGVTATPQLTLHSVMTNSQDDGQGNGNDAFTLGTTYYTTRDHSSYPNGVYTGSTQYSFNGQYNNGYNTGYTRAYVMYPNPMDRIYQRKVNATNSLIHPLYPVHIYGIGYTSTAPLLNAKVPYLYRTTDQIAPNVDTVTVNSASYRVLRMHKTGNYNFQSTSANATACYLLPETIGGY